MEQAGLSGVALVCLRDMGSLNSQRTMRLRAGRRDTAWMYNRTLACAYKVVGSNRGLQCDLES